MSCSQRTSAIGVPLGKLCWEVGNELKASKDGLKAWAFCVVNSKNLGKAEWAEIFFWRERLLINIMWQTYEKDACIIFYALSCRVVYFHSLILEKIYGVGGDKCFQDWRCLWIVIMCEQSWTFHCLFLCSEMINSYVCCFTYGFVVRQHKLKDSECSFSFLIIAWATVIPWSQICLMFLIHISIMSLQSYF